MEKAVRLSAIGFILIIGLLLTGCSSGGGGGDDDNDQGPGGTIATTCSESDRFVFTDIGLIMDAAKAGVSVGTAVADSTAYVTPEGKVRMYFFAAGKGHLSAISDDGIDFTLEEGVRIAHDPNLMGPHIKLYKLADGRIRLYQGAGAADGIISRISDNGLDFTLEPGVRITEAEAGMEPLSWLTVAPAPGGGYRGYFTALGIPSAGIQERPIKSATSSDLLAWSMDPGARVGPGAGALADHSGGQSHALPRSNGCVTLFFYSGHYKGEPRIPGDLMYSTAVDGVTFTTIDSLGLDGNGPDIVQMPDGTHLLYYDVGRPEQGFSIRVGRLELAQ